MGREDIEEHIAEKLAEGIEVTADDFEGWTCAHCGDDILFEDIQRDPDAVVHLDIPEGDLEGDTGYYHRHHFCSPKCREEAASDLDWMLGNVEKPDPDVVNPQDVDNIVDVNSPSEWKTSKS